MSNIQTGAERMPHDLSHLGFLAGQIGRLITISTTPVIGGDSFEMDAVGALCLFFSSRRRHTEFDCDWSSDVCSSDLIAAAVRRLPPEYYQKRGAALDRALRRRRDHLPRISDRYYALLAGVVEIHGTDDRDIAEIERLPGGRVSVRLSAPAGGGAPFYHRTFHREETEEIRLYLHGGDDRLVVRGVDGSGPLVRVIGGGGDDQVTASPRAGTTRF